MAPGDLEPSRSLEELLLLLQHENLLLPQCSLKGMRMRRFRRLSTGPARGGIQKRPPSNRSLSLPQLLFDGWRLWNEQLLLQLDYLTYRAFGLYEAFFEVLRFVGLKTAWKGLRDWAFTCKFPCTSAKSSQVPLQL